MALCHNVMLGASLNVMAPFHNVMARKSDTSIYFCYGSLAYMS